MAAGVTFTIPDPIGAEASKTTPWRRRSILVTDGEQRSALAVVRALGRAGHRITVCSTRSRSLAGASRYTNASVRAPDPLHESRSFIEHLSLLVRRYGIDVVIPMTDASMLSALEGADRLAPAVLPVADLECYRAISNKERVLGVAPRFGIAVPSQQTISLHEARRISELEISFPVVVKPARSVGEHDGRREHFAVSYARNAVELSTVVKRTDPAAFPLLLQQRVVGPGVGIFLLMWDGETSAVFSHRRLREKPPSGGVSVYRESIAADPELVARSQGLLEHFGWRGVAMIEYKVDERTGIPYLMEINGRFWGSLQLAVDAGVDFPNLLLSVALDGERPAAPPYLVGVRSRWWWGDVDQLVTRLRRSARSLALPDNSPSRWQSVLDFMRLGGTADRNEIFRLEDPGPFVRETIDWFRGK